MRTFLLSPARERYPSNVDFHLSPSTSANLIAAVTAERAAALLLLLRHLDDGNGDGVEAELVDEVLGVLVDLEGTGIGGGVVESGDLRDVLVLALTLLLLKLEGDTADGTALDTLHEVGGVTSNLVSHQPTVPS